MSRCLIAAPVTLTSTPLGKRTVTESTIAASPSPKCRSNEPCPLKLFCAEICCTMRLEMPPIVARTQTRAPIAARFETVPTQCTSSQPLSDPGLLLLRNRPRVVPVPWMYRSTSPSPS